MTMVRKLGTRALSAGRISAVVVDYDALNRHVDYQKVRN
jgi:hypothetical protein